MLSHANPLESPAANRASCARNRAEHPALVSAIGMLLSSADGAPADATVRLHPEPAVDAPYNAQLAVLPNFQNARWLLPAHSACAGALSTYVPFTWRGRLGKAALWGLSQLRTLRWFPARLTISCDHLLPLQALACELFGCPHVVLAATVGTPGKYRKILVQVLRPSGELLGVIKLAMAPAANARIQAETEALMRLAQIPTLARQVSRVLHAGRWAGGRILVQEAAPPQPSPPHFGACHQGFLDKLLAATLRVRSAAAVVDEVVQSWRSVSTNYANRTLEQRALQRARAALLGQKVNCALSHGDFAPWNLRLCRDGLFAVDWEAARLELPHIWDRFHFLVQTASLLRKGERQLRQTLQSDRQAHSLFLLYLVRSLAAAYDEQTPDPAQISYRLRLLREVL